MEGLDSYRWFGHSKLSFQVLLTLNRPFHVKQWNVSAVIIKRDVTAGVHSLAVLGYFTILVYDNNALA